MPYYHDLITEKSWQALQELKRRYEFILIGGWAVYLYTKALKSRDIDLICSYEELEKLKADHNLIKNERLKKYEIHHGEFDIDIYVPFYSDLGIPVEDLQKMTKSVSGFRVLNPEALLILKQKAFKDRAGSLKGEKDKIDIIALLKEAVDIKKYKNLLIGYGFKDCQTDLKQLLKTIRDIPELDLKAHAFARIKKGIILKLD